MEIGYTLLIALGGILLLGLVADFVGRYTLLPRVTTILVFGALVGPHALDVIPQVLLDNFDLIAQVVLIMVGFLLGERLAVEELKKTGRATLVISITAVVTTCCMVALALWIVGTSIQTAVLLGCIAAATAPAASVDVVFESGNQGKFAKRLLAIVALDDVWALLLFSLGLSLVLAMAGSVDSSSPMLFASKEIFGAILLGTAIGLPASYLTGRIKPGQPVLSEALGLVLLCGGLALWLDVSYLITSMVMGVVIANFALHHEQPFRAIEGLEWPLLAIFFVLAGASLDFTALQSIGLIGGVYVVSRVAGKVLGAWIGGVGSSINSEESGWIGLAMLPQAGAAMGMALVASSQFPEYRQILLSVVISSTILFELVGPIFTRKALSKYAG